MSITAPPAPSRHAAPGAPRRAPRRADAAPAIADDIPDDISGDILAARPALLAFARRLSLGGAEAEDLVQETMVKALAARHRFEPGTRLQSWLFTILRNTFNSAYLRSRRLSLPGPEVIESALRHPATQGSDLWAAATIRRLVEDLTPAHREVLILVTVLGFTYEETADLCGCSVGTVKSRLNRARRALAAIAGPAPD